MASYRIVCTEQVPVTEPTAHAHIVVVGTGNAPDRAQHRSTLADVIRAIEVTGDSFHTVNPSTGKQAKVVVEACGHCGRKIIRSSADAVKDNNLDSLRRCRFTQSWKAAGEHN